MKKSLKMISVATALGVLLTSGTAFAALAAWHASAKRSTTPFGSTYKWEWTNVGVTKKVDWWVGWNFGVATASSNTTNGTPHQAASIRCTRTGWIEVNNVAGVSPTGNWWSGANGPESNVATCPWGYSSIQGQVGIYH